MLDTIWVVAEPSESGGVKPASRELLTGAREMARSVSAIVWGTRGDGATSVAPEVASELARFGASTIYWVGDIGRGLPAPAVAKAMAAAVRERGAPDAILIPQTYDGRDIVARVSVLIDRPILSNVSGLSFDERTLVAHTVFGGTQTVKTRLTSPGTALYLVRPMVFKARAEEAESPEVVALPTHQLGRIGAAIVESYRPNAQAGPSLEDAKVIVSGGRGLGDRSNYGLIEELAKLLHGASGASRAIVDSGWVPYAKQVGQTGATVKPTVYLAAGISGAMQHLAGMKGAETVIAINTDPEAPIFQIADLGVVGDAIDVLTKLIEAVSTQS